METRKGNEKMNSTNADEPTQRKKSEKQRRLGPAPIASFEMSFDDSTNIEVRSKVCKNLILFYIRYQHVALLHMLTCTDNVPIKCLSIRLYVFAVIDYYEIMK